jgi:hypothetical protein
MIIISKIKWKLWIRIQTFFDGFLYQFMGFNTSNSKAKDFAKEISYGGKFFVQEFSYQNAINDNDTHLMFWNLHYCRERTIISLELSVFLSNGVTVICNWLRFPNNSWDYADIGLTTGFLSKKRMVLTLPDEEGFLILELQYDYKVSFICHVWEASTNLDQEIKWVIFLRLHWLDNF